MNIARQILRLVAVSIRIVDMFQCLVEPLKRMQCNIEQLDFRQVLCNCPNSLQRRRQSSKVGPNLRWIEQSGKRRSPRDFFLEILGVCRVMLGSQFGERFAGQFVSERQRGRLAVLAKHDVIGSRAIAAPVQVRLVVAQLDTVQVSAADDPDSPIILRFEFDDAPFSVVFVAAIEGARPR